MCGPIATAACVHSKRKQHPRRFRLPAQPVRTPAPAYSPAHPGLLSAHSPAPPPTHCLRTLPPAPYTVPCSLCLPRADSRIARWLSGVEYMAWEARQAGST